MSQGCADIERDGTTASSTLPVVRLSPEGAVEEHARLAMEEAVTIAVNDEELVTLLASPEDREALVVGFLFNEGIIDDAGQIQSVTADGTWMRVEAKGVQMNMRLYDRRVLGSGCGRGVSFSTALDAFAATRRTRPHHEGWVKLEVLLASAEDFFSRGPHNKRLRGTHSAGLFDWSGRVVAHADDIGRHSAVDKVVGKVLLSGASLEDLFLLVTGRVSSDMVGKIMRTPIPLVLSKSVPTALAVELAEPIFLTIAGRPTRTGLTVYSHQRLIASPQRAVEI